MAEVGAVDTGSGAQEAMDPALEQAFGQAIAGVGATIVMTAVLPQVMETTAEIREG